MLKTFQREITILHKIIDVFVILISWLLAFYLRFNSISLDHIWYLKYSVLLLIIQYFFFRQFGLYGSQRLKSIRSELFATVKANVVVLAVFVISIYFLSPEKISRVVLINYGLLSTSCLVLVKLTVRSFLRYQRLKGLNLRYVLLVGDGKQIEDYIKVIKSNPEIGLRLKAWHGSTGINNKYEIQNLETLSVETLRQLEVDYIVIGYSFKDFAKVDEALKKISTELLNITILPDLTYALIGHEISEFGGVPAISLNQPHFSSKSIIIKRVFDLVLSGVGLIMFSPILILIAIGVKLSSPGPIIFGQRRVGLDGKEFHMWKFRTMKVDSEATGAGWTVSNDPRKTKFGTFLRKTSLDELPQLWNVFIGEMSLVGPRPEQPYFVQKFKGEIPAYMLRHKMKAGITGWAQVNGWRGDTSIAARIECDIWYIKNWSIWLDMGILILTLWKGNKNAY